MRLVQEEILTSDDLPDWLYIVCNGLFMSSLFLQLIIYVVVAANRYTAISHPIRHQEVSDTD